MKPGFDFYYKQKESSLPTSCDVNPESIINSQSGRSLDRKTSVAQLSAGLVLGFLHNYV